MRRAAGFAILVLTAGVSLPAAARDYGKFNAVRTPLNTTCATVLNFDERLRASPKLEAPDRFVAYLDFGGGLPRPAFLISPIQFDAAMTAGELLAQTDRRRNPMWAEAQLVAGVIEVGNPFEIYVPELSEKIGDGATIVRCPATLVRAQVQAACGKHYLVAALGNPLGGEGGGDTDWQRVRAHFDEFLANIRWP